mgnify:CR=1 FL=1
MAQIAYAWVGSRPGITAPIVGISRAAQLDDAVAESVAVGADGAIYVGETVTGETLTGLAGGNLVRKFTRQP